MNKPENSDPSISEPVELAISAAQSGTSEVARLADNPSKRERVGRITADIRSSLGDDLLDLKIGQIGVWHAVRLIPTTVGGAEELCKPFRGEILAMKDRCKRRRWRVPNRQSVLVGGSQRGKSNTVRRPSGDLGVYLLRWRLLGRGPC